MSTANKGDITINGIPSHIDEEIDYTAEYDGLFADDFLDEGDVEDPSIRDLVDQLEAMRPEDDLYDTITQDEKFVRRVRDEDYELFPLAKKAKSDTSALGAQLLKRKIELMEEMALLDEYEEDLREENESKKKFRLHHGKAA